MVSFSTSSINIALAAVIAAKKATINEGILPWIIAKILGVHCRPSLTLKEAFVLCERGGANLQRWANGKYRGIVLPFRPSFFRAVSNGEKGNITNEAHQQVKDAGLELVRQFKSPDKYPYLQEGRYYYLLDSKVYTKIIQFIRDGKPGTGKNKISLKNVSSKKAGPKVVPRVTASKSFSLKRARKTSPKISNKAPSSKIGLVAAPEASLAPAPKSSTEPASHAALSLGVMGAPFAPVRNEDIKMAPVSSVAQSAPADEAVQATIEDEREVWAFWEILSDAERQTFARRRGYLTIEAYEEHLGLQMSSQLKEDCTFGAAIAALPAAVATVSTKQPVSEDVSGLDDVPLEDFSSEGFLEGLDLPMDWDDEITASLMLATGP